MDKTNLQIGKLFNDDAFAQDFSSETAAKLLRNLAST